MKHYLICNNICIFVLYVAWWQWQKYLLIILMCSINFHLYFCYQLSSSFNINTISDWKMVLHFISFSIFSLYVYILFSQFISGKSLVWVAILGLVLFYLYALISFAMLRSTFNPDDSLYCATLWQCTVTVIRYGLIGDIFDVRLF